MKPTCDSDDYAEDVNTWVDDDYQKKYDEKRIKDLILISRLALVLHENQGGHPITHITGVPIDEIAILAEAYAPGVNLGVHMPHKDFPHNSGRRKNI